MDNISSNVMLAHLNISIWSARRFDERATNEVNVNHAAINHNIGRFNKLLIPENSSSYIQVQKISTEIRRWFYNVTLDYDQMGVRILPSSMYMEVSDRIREYRREFALAVEAFLNDIDNLKEEAKQLLNGLFRESDYLPPEELFKKFEIRFFVLPFPNAAHFGVNLPETEMTVIKDSIDNYADEAVGKAMRDLWERLFGVVSKITERLSQPNAGIRNSLVENARELVALLPRLNFTEDETLENLRKQVEQKLVIHDPETLRSNIQIRNETARQASEIQSIMAAYMGVTLTEQEKVNPLQNVMETLF
ncbi:MAG: hypothetical protein KGI54_05765 [Pseudomonadota bacterium]|nr:hypothetical protein [Pseudomonadota bacterium]